MLVSKKEYSKADLDTHKKNERIRLEQERKILELHQAEGDKLIRAIRPSGKVSKGAYSSYVINLSKSLKSLITINSQKISENTLKSSSDVTEKLLRGSKLDTDSVRKSIERQTRLQADKAVKLVMSSDMYKDGRGLSQRVWGSSVKASNDIRNVITAGMKNGLSSVEIAKLLEGYVDFEARKRWSNDKIKEKLGEGYAAYNRELEYNSLRLARTTLSHVHTESKRNSNKVNPYATHVRWHALHLAGRTCQICIELDQQLFKLEEVPLDHPNGMCYLTTEYDLSMNDMIDDIAGWINGDDNEMLEEWYKELIKT